MVEPKPIEVYIVNDHKIVLWGLERLIASATPRTKVAGTAESCDALIPRLSVVRPDVIVLDLDSGGGTLSCLQRLAVEHAARVLILTGSNDPAAHHQAAVRGARGVVSKKAEPETLLRAIEKVHQGELWLDRGTLGRAMTTLASPQKHAPDASKLSALTCKERLIVNTLVREKGARNKIIANKLHISEHTLRNHFTTIYDKLQVSGRMELFLLAASQIQGEHQQLIAA